MTIDNTLYLEALKKGDLDYFHKLFNAVADSAVADEKKMSSRLELSAGIAIANKHFDLARFFVSKMDLPETEKAVKEIMSLPLHCGLCDSDVQLVIQAIRDFFNKE